MVKKLLSALWLSVKIYLHIAYIKLFILHKEQNIHTIKLMTDALIKLDELNTILLRMVENKNKQRKDN